MTRLFIDTGIWIAAVSPRDPGAPAVDALIERIRDREWASVHTSDLILAETLNYVRMKMKRREPAESLVEHVFGADDAPPLVTSVLRVHAGLFAAALERYRTEFRRGLSFTDWSTVVAMEEHGIHELATFDKGFRGTVRVASLRDA